MYIYKFCWELGVCAWARARSLHDVLLRKEIFTISASQGTRRGHKLNLQKGLYVEISTCISFVT